MAILFLLLFGPEKLPVVIVEGMKMFRQLRAAAEEATGEIRREFEAAASEIEAAKLELTSAVDEVQRFGAETRALVDQAQRDAVSSGAADGTDGTATTSDPAAGAVSTADASTGDTGAADDTGTADDTSDDTSDDIGSILPPDMAEMLRAHDVDPAEHAIEAMGGPRREADRPAQPAKDEPAPEVDA